MTQMDLGWIAALAKPQTTEDRMLQSVVLSFVDPAVYECPVDILRHMPSATRDLAKIIISEAKNPSSLSAMREMASAMDQGFDQGTLFFDIRQNHGHYGRVKFRWEDSRVCSVSVNMKNFGEDRFYQRLRYLRDRLLWSLRNPTASKELSAPLNAETSDSSELLSLITSEQMERVVKPQSSLDRWFQVSVLHLVDPAVYFTTIDKMGPLPASDLRSFFALLEAMDRPGCSSALVKLAEDADRGFTAKAGYLEKFKGGFRVCVRNGDKAVKIYVNPKDFGGERTQKRLRFLKDRVLFDIAVSSMPSIMSLHVGLQLKEDIQKNRNKSLFLIFRYTSPENGRYKMMRSSCKKHGFNGSFSDLSRKAENMGFSLSPDSIRNIRPTAEQFSRYSEHVPDLPLPFS